MKHFTISWSSLVLTIAFTTTILADNSTTPYSCCTSDTQASCARDSEKQHTVSTDTSYGIDTIYRIKQDCEFGHQGNNPHMHSLNPKNVLLSIITGIGNGLLTGFGNAAAEKSLLKGFSAMNWASLLTSWTIAGGIRGTLDSLSQNYFLSIKTPYNTQVLCGSSYVASWISYVFAYTQFSAA